MKAFSHQNFEVSSKPLKGARNKKMSLMGVAQIKSIRKTKSIPDRAIKML